MSQSQGGLEETIAEWSVRQCSSEIDTILPKLIESFKLQKNPYGVAQVLFAKMALAVGTQQMETLVFSRIAEQTEALFSRVFQDIHVLLCSGSEIQEIQHQINSQLQQALNLIGSLEQCASGIVTAETDIYFADVHSLLPLILNVIHKSYDHCKRSTEIYSEMLSAFSHQLSALFKRVHALQMVLLNLLEKIKTSETPDMANVEDVCFVLQKMFEIADLAQTLDIKITISLWKAFSKLACHTKTHIYDKLRISDILSSLCLSMTTSFQYLIGLLPKDNSGGDGNDKAFGKTVKILGFQMKLLVRLTEEFAQALDECCVRNVHKLCLIVQSKSKSCISARDIPQRFSNEIENQLTNAVPLLVRHLSTIESYCHVILNKDYNKNDEVFPRCLCLLHCVDNFHQLSEDQIEMWMSNASNKDESGSIFHAIFDILPQCYVELSETSIVQLPGLQQDQSSMDNVSLYEYITVKLCCLAATCPQQYFHVLEECLLQNVLQRQQIKALLTIDVWCFLVRYGNAELCRDHCVFLCTLLTSLESVDSALYLKMLISRLVKFIAPEHQEYFMKTFPVEDNPQLWAILPLHVFDGAVCEAIVTAVVQKFNTVVAGFVKAEETCAEKLLHLKNHLECLTNILRHQTVLENHVREEQLRNVVQQLSSLLSPFSDIDPKLQECRLQKQCLGALFECCSYVTFAMDTPVIESLLNVMGKCLEDASTDIKLTHLSVLTSLRAIFFPPSSQQASILTSISSLFMQLLADSHVIVRQSALSVFAMFAEKTQHEGIVPACLDTSQDIHDSVVHYLNRVANKETVKRTSTPEQFRSQLTSLQNYWNMSNENLFPEDEVFSRLLENNEDENKQPRKRIRCDDDQPTNVEDQCRSILQTIRESVSDLNKTCGQLSAKPDWLVSDINAAIISLKGCLEN